MKIQYQSPFITVFESALYRTTSSIINIGQSLLLVDPNWLPIEIEFIKNYISMYHNGKQLYLLFTHSDYDHIIGYGAFPDAKTIAGQDFVNNPIKDKCVQQILDFDDQYYIERDYPISYPIIDVVVEKEGQKVFIDDFELIFNSAVGHINNGLITVIPHLDLIIAGDYLSNIEIPMVEYSFDTYYKTLKTFKKIIDEKDIKLLINGHGDIALNMRDIGQRIDNDMSYLNSFLNDFYLENPNFNIEINRRGHFLQNSRIHQRNLDFFSISN